MSAATARAAAPVWSPETRRAYAEAARIERMRRSLYEFLKGCWHVIEPGVTPLWNWHMEALCFHIQAMLEGWLVAAGHAPANGNARQREMRARVAATWSRHGLKFKRNEVLVQNAVFNLAPSTLKSRILMVVAPAWMWLHCPTWSVCAISSVDDNVRRDSNDHRDLVESAWYRETFDITWKLDPRKNSVGDWATTAGGERKSRTILGGFIGMHVDCILLDDPDDAHKVHNESARKEVQYKWRRTIRRRVTDPMIALRIALQQRVHIDDWTAAQIAKGIWKKFDRKAWMWVPIAMEFGKGPADAPTITPFGWSDPRKAANDNMHPERFPPEVIADEIRELGPDGFAAQFNQNPENYDAGMIKRAWVRFFRLEDYPVENRPRPHGCGLRVDAMGKAIVGEDGRGMDTPAIVIPIDPRTRLYAFDEMCLSIDCSNGSESGDASRVGLLVCGTRGLERFIIDDRSAIMDPHTMRTEIARAISDWPQVSTVLVELAALGRSQIADLRVAIERGEIRDRFDNRLSPVVVEVPTGNDSKEKRFQAMVAAWAAGLVYVMDGAAWLYPVVIEGGKTLDTGYVGEITAFPKVKKNDRADSTSQFMTHYREGVSMVERYAAYR